MITQKTYYTPTYTAFIAAGDDLIGAGYVILSSDPGTPTSRFIVQAPYSRPPEQTENQPSENETQV